jgi:hypothetical protein
MNPTDQELLEMRKGLRKRKLPKIHRSCKFDYIQSDLPRW